MERNYIAILSIVAVVAIIGMFSAVMSNTRIGMAYSATADSVQKVSCSDSDGKDNFRVAGYVVLNGARYDDSCRDADHAIDYWCPPSAGSDPGYAAPVGNAIKTNIPTQTIQPGSSIGYCEHGCIAGACDNSEPPSNFTCEASSPEKCIYVQNSNPLCDDSGSGTYAQPLCTINQAAINAVAGDYVYIRAGTYTEQSGVSCQIGGYERDCGILYPRNSGTASAPITYKGYPGDPMPLLKADNYSMVIYLGGVGGYSGNVSKDNLIFQGLKLSNGVFAGVHIISAKNIVIEDCDIYDNGLTWDYDQAQGGISIRYNVPGSAVNIKALNNNIHNNRWINDGIGSGIHSYSCWDCEFKGNTIYDQYAGITLKDYLTFPSEYSNKNIDISSNAISDTKIGILQTANAKETGIRIFENRIFDYNQYGYGIFVANYLAGDITYNEVFNNIIDCDGNNKIGYYQRYAVDSNSSVKNNILYNCIAGSSIRLKNEPAADGQNYSENFIENNNLLYSSAGNQHYSWGTSSGYFIPWTWDQWRTFWQNQTFWPASKGNGLFDVLANPLFVNSEAHNYALLQGSPAIDAGVIISGYHCPISGDVEPDQQGCKIWYGNAPDIGAFESHYTGNSTR